MVRFIEASQMNRAVAFDYEFNLVKQRDEEVDDRVRAVLSKRGDQVLARIMLDPEGSIFLGGGCKDNISKGENFSL